MDQEFREEFRKMCHEDLDEACLTALSILALRHISEKDNYNNILSVLSSIEVSNEKIDKLKEIYSVVNKYDKRLISIMTDIDKKLSSNLNITKITEHKQDIIKKWWN